MVQPNGVPEEIPGNDMMNNIIDQASADIDRELATESQAQPLTADQVQQIVQTQMSQVQNQISGLQSLYDKGLNAIRRDSESDSANAATNYNTAESSTARTIPELTGYS